MEESDEYQHRRHRKTCVQCLKDNNLTELEYQEGDSRIVLKDESNTMESPVSGMGMGYPYGQPMYSRQRSTCIFFAYRG